MHRKSRIPLYIFAGSLVVAAACGAGCSGDPPAEGDAERSTDFADRPSWGGHGGEGGAAPTELPCRQPNAVPLPARSSVMTAEPSSAERPFFTRDLFVLFQAHCGGCHVDTALGGFDDQRVTFDNFSELVDEEALKTMRSDDPDVFMPKPVAGGKPWSERVDGDPIRELAGLIEAWIAAGSPSDIFFLASEGGDQGSPFLLSKKRGLALTNLGSCLPDPETFAAETKRSLELDQRFAKMTELPERLEETDLFTFDSAMLAYHGVFAVAPTYPLWSDDAGKIRQVRLPRGTSMAYDSKTNEFEIPDNTRVYKTFLKEVIDAEGKKAFRKMETRLIVARQDDCSVTPCRTRALYGTYVWNDAETEAVLLRDPLRNGQPFRDRVVTYVTDEPNAEEAGTDAELLSAVSRRYAIPGSIRCVQCHMGAPTKTFLLGMAPVQLNRLPFVEEPDPWVRGDELVGDGVLEEDDPLPDELNQLERLIELGVVTGLDSPQELPHLKELGSAPPRNAFELTAQGYVLGNCSNCHNPRGFPSVKLPEIRDLLDFYPADDGGIHQFPLERYSPRVFRGALADHEVPYITPSLWDRFNVNAVQSSTPDPLVVNAVSKCITAPLAPGGRVCVEAPWRSLIYRNVDTPFAATDDYAIYPHMPRHVAGFDCRAPRILGEWMVSIPALLKASEMTDPNATPAALEEASPASQPLEEVLPGESGYAAALSIAVQRMEEFRAGERYAYCPDASDIQDPDVLAGEHTAPQDLGQYLEGQPALPWKDGVPDRAHFVVTDPTDIPGDWTPRRADWADVVLAEDPEKLAALPDQEREVVELLEEEDLELDDDFVDFALDPILLGLWKAEPTGACDGAYAGLPKLASIPVGEEPYWEDASGLDTTLPLFYGSRGATVFNTICRNCHGPAANADTALADTISDISGGATRVANLRDGLFGPPSNPGSFAEKVFGERAEDLDVSPDALQARYLLWMALGGTRVEIPISALKIVQNARVLGERRWGDSLPSANMLSNAENICRATLPAGALSKGTYSSVEAAYTGTRPILKYDLRKGIAFSALDVVNGRIPLITRNGDAEMWTDLCAARRKSPVRAIRLNWDALQYVAPLWTTLGDVATGGSEFGAMYLLFDPDLYGDSPVMTPDGVRNGVPVGEAQVWCLERAKTPLGLERQAAWAFEHTVDGQPYPICPEGVGDWGIDELREFATRGAMNAGLAVLVYLRAVANGEIEPELQYNECRRL